MNKVKLKMILIVTALSLPVLGLFTNLDGYDPITDSIIVTGTRPTFNPYEGSGAATFFGSYDTSSSDAWGGAGGGYGEDSTNDSEDSSSESDEEEDECLKAFAAMKEFLETGKLPSSAKVVGIGEAHASSEDEDPSRYEENLSYQKSVIRAAQADGSRVCLALEANPNDYSTTSQYALGAWAQNSGIQTMNMDNTQADSYWSSAEDVGVMAQEFYIKNSSTSETTYESLQSTASMNLRDVHMATNVESFLSSPSCDKMVFVVGAAHLSNLGLSANTYGRVTMAQLLSRNAHLNFLKLINSIDFVVACAKKLSSN